MNNASIRVTFGNEYSGSDAHLSAEIDDREGGLNGGRTTFAPGDSVWFLVYKSANVVIDSVVTSAGSITLGGAVSVTKDVELEFPDTNSATSDIPVNAISAPIWLGTSLGALTLQEDKMTITAARKGVAVCKVSSESTATSYKLTAPATLPGPDGPVTEFSVVVVVTGSVVAP